MTEGIKEILDKLKYIVDFPIIEHDASFNSDNVEESVCLLISNECQLLLDYITNLQQENERLKEDIRQDKVQFECFELAQECDNRQDKIDLLTNQLKDYKSRCEKAIEYIENNKKETSSYFNGKEYVYRNFTLCCEPNDLLNILNGSDEE